MIVRQTTAAVKRIAAYRKLAEYMNEIADQLESGWVLDSVAGEVGGIEAENDFIEYVTWDKPTQNIGFDRVEIFTEIKDQWVRKENG